MISACIGTKDWDKPGLLIATIDNCITEGVDEIMLCNFGAESLQIERPNLYHIHIPLDRWRLGLAFNICALPAIGETLLLINGGIVISPGMIADSLPLVIPGVQFVSSAKHYFRCAYAATESYLNDYQVDLTSGADAYTDQSTQNALGSGCFCLIAHIDFNMTIGGWRPDMEGWGRDDVDFHRRAEQLGYKRQLGIGSIYHLCDGYPMSRQSEPEYKFNDELLKTSDQWWRMERRIEQLKENV